MVGQLVGWWPVSPAGLLATLNRPADQLVGWLVWSVGLVTQLVGRLVVSQLVWSVGDPEPTG